MPSISKQDVVSTYAHYATWYDRLFGAVLEPGRRRLAQVVREQSPQTLLEIGVGTGLALPLYPATTQVMGIDLSDAMLERARHRARTLSNRNINLKLMDAEQMDFPDHSFECITLPYVLSVTPHPERLVAEIRRVCKPNGTILVLNHFSGSRFWWMLEQLVRPLASRIGFRSEFSIDEHILTHDWQVESVTAVNMFGLSRLVVIRNASEP